jgi:protein-L-isoaspartate(D-aspartate) O-methyltransferase
MDAMAPDLEGMRAAWRARRPGWLLATALGLGGCNGREPAETAHGAAPSPEELALDGRRAERERMVARQLATRGITDERVLAALRAVPRHRFVPPEQGRDAYADSALAIGHGQTISQPFVVAFMTQALALSGDERVLEIGTGSGYQSAILARLVHEVWSIEIVEPLAARATAVLAELGHANVHVRHGDGYLGWPEHAPFDAILVAAAPEHVPQPLLDQLAVGGRLILPVGSADQELLLIRRTSDGYERESVLPVRFVPMTGLAEERDG